MTSAGLDLLIKELAHHFGITFVIVTHELASIYNIADRVIMLDARTRTIIAEGKPAELARKRRRSVGAPFFQPRTGSVPTVASQLNVMSTTTNNFKLGLFTLCGLAILIAGVLAFGARSYFEPTSLFETYVAGDVTGLAVGSAVELRGVHVGKSHTHQFFLERISGNHAELYRRGIRDAERRDAIAARRSAQRDACNPPIKRGFGHGSKARASPARASCRSNILNPD